MRSVCLILVLVMAFTAQLCCGAAELLQQVPQSSSAYEKLALLRKTGLLYSDQDTPLTAPTAHLLTRNQFGLQLVEPLQRLIALVKAKNTVLLSPEERQRHDLALRALSQLSEADCNRVLNATADLTATFKDVIEQISPGLCKSATDALSKLKLNQYRPWVVTTPAPPNGMVVSVSVDTKAPPTNIPDLLPVSPNAIHFSPTVLARGSAGSSTDTTLLGTKSVSKFDAAVSIVFKGGYKLYGQYATLPGTNLLSMSIADLMNGTGKIGATVPFASFGPYALSYFVEVEGMRTSDASSVNFSSVQVSGVTISWK